MTPTLVLDVVGLSDELLGPDTPHLSALAKEGAQRRLRVVLPAVTCSVQSTFTTGALPAAHGCVANGWYFREVAEVALWKQSNHLVHGEKIWEAAKARDASFTCAKLFWWFNMYSSADWSVTPRPIYWADGLKVPDFYTEPPQLHGRLKAELGDFPLFKFWGPGASLESSEWIAACALRVMADHSPTLTLVYLPHLDYDLQRLGPAHPDVKLRVGEVDALCGRLIDAARARGARVLVLSEYAIDAVVAPVHINRALREAGLIRVREERGLEKLDAGASRAFAVADHQLAHVYVRSAADVPAVRALLERLDGVAQVLDGAGKREAGLDHPNAGELVAVSRNDRWFTYYYWLDDALAPEWARTVDIHRKPGYDPVELFMAGPKAKAGFVLLKKLLGFRYLMDVIPLDASLVKGSHGARLTGPVLLSSERELLDTEPEVVRATEVKRLVLSHLFD